MRNIKLTIEYDGTHFSGWQVQDQRKRTVQGEIEKALKTIFKKKIRLIGSGRTDSGVHALGQVAHFKTTSPTCARQGMPTAEMLNALNANLPEDIAVLESSEVPDDFHAQYSAKRKTYRYCILNRQSRSAVKRHSCLHFPHTLNLKAMQEESKSLVGRKDFRSFMAANPAERNTIKDKNTVRTIHAIKILKHDDYIYIRIEANGFLYKMVRNIVGTLLAVGTGKLPKGSIRKILKEKNRSSAPATAASKGLCLLDVSY